MIKTDTSDLNSKCRPKIKGSACRCHLPIRNKEYRSTGQFYAKSTQSKMSQYDANHTGNNIFEKKKLVPMVYAKVQFSIRTKKLELWLVSKVCVCMCVGGGGTEE